MGNKKKPCIGRLQGFFIANFVKLFLTTLSNSKKIRQMDVSLWH